MAILWEMVFSPVAGGEVLWKYALAAQKVDGVQKPLKIAILFEQQICQCPSDHDYLCNSIWQTCHNSFFFLEGTFIYSI
jgi:hypothetical protein